MTGPGQPPFRAAERDFLSDAVRLEHAPDGGVRYFRADDPEGEEYTYRKPFILELEITRRCNLKCLHCYAEAGPSDFSDELTLEEIGAVLDDARAAGMRELSLTGGEVMTHPRFMDIVDAGFERGFNVRFVTNATLLDDAILEGLRARPIKLITVSLDAVTPEAHERIRGPGTHAPAVEGIDRLVGAGMRLSVITAFSEINVGEFDALLEFCVSRGLDWQVQMTSAKGRCARGITLSPEGYYALGEKVAAAFAADLPVNVIPMDDLATFSHFEPLARLSSTWQGRCTGGLLNIFVRANGDVTPCSALAFDECVAGNVRTDGLARILEEERCRRVLYWAHEEPLRGVCAECPFAAECNGGCPEILLCMCTDRRENEYCYHRIEQERILKEAIGDE